LLNLAVEFKRSTHAAKPLIINPATIYITFRVSRKRQIKARLAVNGHSIGKSRNAEQALS